MLYLEIADVESFIGVHLQEFVQVLAKSLKHHTEVAPIMHERILYSKYTKQII